MSTPYRALYDALQQCDERNYAKDHSYESWLDWYINTSSASQVAPPAREMLAISLCGHENCADADEYHTTELLHRIAVALSQVATEKEKVWEPIETAPTEQEILGGWYYNDKLWVWGRCEHDSDGWFCRSGGRPTHWMPLPVPPGLEAARTDDIKESK